MLKRPTIIEVAEKAGVSKSTVSLVLQNSALVKEETRANVREAMAAIGYVYNCAAADTRSSNVGLIGLVINDLVAFGLLSGFARLGKTIEIDFQLVGFDDSEEGEQPKPESRTGVEIIMRRSSVGYHHD